MKTNQIIPIFYACDDNFVKYTIVSLHSMIKNASKEYKYHVYILNTNITKEMQDRLMVLANENFEISFEDVTNYLHSIADKFPIRDYYSKTTYFRLFIAEMFPQYNKAIYIDSDTIVQGDISNLYEIDLKDYYVGACHEQAMVQVNEYGTYVEKCVGVSRYSFFNAGMILINCKQFRDHKVLEKFIKLLQVYKFVVTQDEDYLNVICKNHVLWLNQKWNTEVFGEIPYPIKDAFIIHYIMVSKPWHYQDCRFGNIFWQYAEETNVYEDILDVLNGYTDKEKENDQISADNLLKLAIAETNNKNNYLNSLNKVKQLTENINIMKNNIEYKKEKNNQNSKISNKMILTDDINY